MENDAKEVKPPKKGFPLLKSYKSWLIIVFLLIGVFYLASSVADYSIFDYEIFLKIFRDRGPEGSLGAWIGQIDHTNYDNPLLQATTKIYGIAPKRNSLVNIILVIAVLFMLSIHIKALFKNSLYTVLLILLLALLPITGLVTRTISFRNTILNAGLLFLGLYYMNLYLGGRKIKDLVISGAVYLCLLLSGQHFLLFPAAVLLLYRESLGSDYKRIPGGFAAAGLLVSIIVNGPAHILLPFYNKLYSINNVFSVMYYDLWNTVSPAYRSGSLVIKNSLNLGNIVLALLTAGIFYFTELLYRKYKTQYLEKRGYLYLTFIISFLTAPYGFFGDFSTSSLVFLPAVFLIIFLADICLKVYYKLSGSSRILKYALPVILVLISAFSATVNYKIKGYISSDQSLKLLNKISAVQPNSFFIRKTRAEYLIDSDSIETVYAVKNMFNQFDVLSQEKIVVLKEILMRAYYKLNDFMSVRWVASELLETTPNNETAIGVMTKSFIAEKQYAKAEAFIQKYTDFMREKKSYLYMMAEIKIGKQEYAEAQKYLDLHNSSDISKTDPFALYVTAGNYYKLGKYDKAKEIILHLLTLGNTGYEYNMYQMLAVIYEKEKNFNESIKNYKLILMQNPQNSSANMGLGRLFNDKGLYIEAREYFNKAYALNPLLEDEIKDIIRASGDTNVSDIFDTSLLSSTTLQSLYSIGLDKISSDSYTEAEKYFNEILNYDKTSPQVHNQLGIISIMKGDYKTALSELTKALDLEKNFTTAYVDRGRLYLEMNKPDSAVADFKSAIKLYEKFDMAWYNMGIAYMNLSDTGQALAAYKKALEINPLNLDARFNYGNVLWNQKKLEEALKQFGGIVDVFPGRINAWINLGLVKSEMGEKEEAVSILEKVSKYFPDYYIVKYNLARLYLDAKNKDKARKMIEEIKGNIDQKMLDELTAKVGE